MRDTSTSSAFRHTWRWSAHSMIAMLLTCVAITGCARNMAVSSPVGQVLPTLESVGVEIISSPPGAAVTIDGSPVGHTPALVSVPSGSHIVEVSLEGFSIERLPIEVPPDTTPQRLTVQLQDIQAPSITVAPLANPIERNQGLKIIATGMDNVGVTQMALMIDDNLVAQVDEDALRHNLDTTHLSSGPHDLVITAQDAAGNHGYAQFTITVVSPTATLAPSHTPTNEPSATQIASLAPTATILPTARATPTMNPIHPVVVSWGSTEIDTYGYEAALYTDPEQTGHPYPLLNRSQVGPPRPKQYRTLSMRNEYLELVFLPELGGRLYQIRYLPTGQDLLYNNQVIKPTHWGPVDQGWWLAVGGIEFCLPVDEHGYVTAEPWEIVVEQDDDGSASANMSITEHSRGLIAHAIVTLRPGDAGFYLKSTILNPSNQPITFQYWINAMLSPGSPGIGADLHFSYPASQVIVHSRGDSALPEAGQNMSWPQWGDRDWSTYATWQNWLGIFAPELNNEFTAVYAESADIGLVRTFPADIAQGVKLFGFGSGFGDEGAYTDDGTQYVEMWGGLTPTFWDNAALAPGATISWEDYWYPIARCGTPQYANRALSATITWESDGLEITIFAPRPASNWELNITQGTQAQERFTFSIRPEDPFRTHVENISRNSAEIAIVRIMNERGDLIASYSTSP